jgi:sortase A
MEVGDRIIIFYQGRRYDYIVFDKTITKPEETHFLTDSYDQSVLTLQTCDPPGTLLNRLVVRAKLAGQ